MPVMEIVEKIPLAVADRCDQCGAQAFVHIREIPLPDGSCLGDLLLCGHHYHDYEILLVAAGYEIQDERDRINSERSSGTAG